MFVSQITYVLVPARRQATWGRHSESCLLLGRFEFKAPPGKDWNVENLNPPDGTNCPDGPHPTRDLRFLDRVFGELRVVKTRRTEVTSEGGFTMRKVDVQRRVDVHAAQQRKTSCFWVGCPGGTNSTPSYQCYWCRLLLTITITVALELLFFCFLFQNRLIT